MGILSFSTEYQKLASDIIQHNHHYLGHQFPDITVPAQQIHGQKQNDCLSCTGTNAAADEFCQFRYYRLRRPVMALKYKGLIGQVGKGHSDHPCDHIADGCGHSHNIITGNVDQVINDGGADTKEQVRYNVPVGFHQLANFLNHLKTKFLSNNDKFDASGRTAVTGDENLIAAALLCLTVRTGTGHLAGGLVLGKRC